MRQLKGIDLKRACLVPSSVFASPNEVVQARGISLAQKLAILRRWEFDARRVTGGARGGDGALGGATMLYQVQRALDIVLGRRPERTSAFGGLVRHQDPPVLGAVEDAAVRSPCAAPGVVSERDRRDFSRV